MKTKLDKIEFIELLEYRVKSRWFHRWLFPNCKKCKNELTVLKEIKDAILGESVK